ncbi:MAG: hypothetical protein LBQ94_09720 [Treponema sp.]|jgi:hypothetical protein|nr:hypothetical protein [Treponema sp.]
MKTTKAFLFLTTLLFALSISAFAGGSLEAAQDVLDILRDASQGGSGDTAGVPPAPAPTQTPATAGDGGPTNWTAVSDRTFSDWYNTRAIAYGMNAQGNNRFVAVGWTGMAYCDW